jgi:type I restriction enzyme, S subunit
MNLSAGYKQTDAGVIPEEWEVLALSDVLMSFQNGFAFASDGYSETGIPIVTMAQIGLDGSFQYDEDRVNYWPASQLIPLAGFKIFYGDLLIAMTDVTPEKNLIGRMTEVTAPGPLFLNQRVGLLRVKKEKITPYYLRTLSNSELWRNYSKAVATLGVQANIGKKEILSGKVPLPPIHEQRTIATALSNVDALIAGLEQLIAKKRNIKQAAIQQLLTGQTRLPGFCGEWEPRPLGALGTTYGGLVGKSKADFGHGSANYVPFVNVMANIRIDCSALEHVDVASTENQNRVLLGDLLFNGSSETPEEVALCALMTQSVENLYLNSFCFGFRLKQGAEASGLFLTYLMRSQMGRELMKSLAQGSTRYNLSKSALLQAILVLPGLEEQTAIATVLSDMDADLSALESRLAKTRAIKQGMMQELLTGRTRLV